MTIFRTIISILLLLSASYIVIMNLGCVIATSRNKRKGIDKHHSTVPIVSAFLAGIAYLVYPFAPKVWIWIIPAIDIGNWGLLWLPVMVLKRGRNED